MLKTQELNRKEIADRFFKLSPQEQREVLIELMDYRYSDDIEDDLEGTIKEYEVA